MLSFFLQQPIRNTGTDYTYKLRNLARLSPDDWMETETVKLLKAALQNMLRKVMLLHTPRTVWQTVREADSRLFSCSCLTLITDVPGSKA